VEACNNCLKNQQYLLSNWNQFR